MQVQFISVKIKGFMSIVNETIDLKDLGVVLVKGINNYDNLFKSNGSGKSAIFDSILWVLTGYTSRGSKNIINRNYNDNGVSVSITMNIDNDEYIITRSMSGSNSGKSLSIIKNDEDISGSTFTKSKEILDQQLSFINYDILTSIIILSQGLPGRLSSLRPSDRKARLEYLSNTDGILEEIQTKMNSAFSELTSESTLKNTERTKRYTSITSNQSTIDSCQRRIDEIIKYQEDNSGINSETIDKYRDTIKSLRDAIEVMRNKYQQICVKESQLLSRKSSVNQEISFLVSKIHELTNQYKSLVNNSCPFCGSVLHDADDLREHISKELIDTKKRYSLLLSEKEKLDNEKLPDSSQYNARINEDNAELLRLSSIIEDYNRLSSSIESYKVTIKECEDKISSFNEELLSIESELKNIDKQLDIYNFYKSAISRKFRNFLLDGVIIYINQRLEYYSEYLFSNGQKVKLENNGNNINIRLGDSYFEDLSGGEGRRVDIILQLAQRDLSRVESGFSCNLLVLDEILDYLDSDGVSNVLSMLEKESSSIDSLMIVTHKEDVDIPNDSELTVIKDKDQLSHIRR